MKKASTRSNRTNFWANKGQGATADDARQSTGKTPRSSAIAARLQETMKRAKPSAGERRNLPMPTPGTTPPKRNLPMPTPGTTPPKRNLPAPAAKRPAPVAKQPAPKPGRPEIRKQPMPMPKSGRPEIRTMPMPQRGAPVRNQRQQKRS